MNRFLFNFAVSRTSGGYKRLYEFSRVFNERGGAIFVAHALCRELQEKFPANRYYFVRPHWRERIWNDGQYLEDIVKEIGRPDLLYSYGIPVYRRLAAVNWFHLSNVLPLNSRGIPLPLGFRSKMIVLGKRIQANYANADVISAESMSSLASVHATDSNRLFLSVNGSDDELRYADDEQGPSDNVAVVVGTYRYKALEDSYKVFEMLRRATPGLTLVIIGDISDVPKALRGRPEVHCTGIIPRFDVIDWLRRARYYLSTTRIENSYNAASEGIHLAEEAFISDIGPHRELLHGVEIDRIPVPGVAAPMIHVHRKNLDALQLKSWKEVVDDVIARTNVELAQRRHLTGSGLPG